MIGSYISKYNPRLATIKRYTNWWNKWTFPYLACRLSTLTSSHSGQTLNIFLSQRVQFIFEMCNNEIFWDNHVGCKYGDLSFIVLRVCKYLVLKFEIEKYWITLWKEKNHTLEWIFNEQIFLFAVWCIICFLYILTCSNAQSGFVSDNRLIDNVESLNCVRKGMFFVGLWFHSCKPINHNVSLVTSNYPRLEIIGNIETNYMTIILTDEICNHAEQ